jgi:hypothetical protein
MKKLLTALCLIAVAATGASADVLWDQSNWNNSTGDGYLNAASAYACNFDGSRTKLHTANDVTFSVDVSISSVSIWQTIGNGNAEGATQGYLWIVPKTGTLPTNASTEVNNAANLVTITNSYETIGATTVLKTTASGLALSLPAGSYWVSLTPRCNVGTIYPYSWHLFSGDGVIGDPTTVISACSANSNWYYPYAPDTQHDTTLMIEGAAVVATENHAWGQVKALYR